MRYILLVSSTSLTPDEVRAAAETHRELGPDYQAAVIESFIDKVGKEIDARVDSRLAMTQPGVRAPRQPTRGGPLALAIVSLGVGIPLTGITEGTHAGIVALAIIWAAIAVINVAYSLSNTLSNRPPYGRR
jgi:hypothetical protein